MYFEGADGEDITVTFPLGDSKYNEEHVPCGQGEIAVNTRVNQIMDFPNGGKIWCGWPTHEGQQIDLRESNSWRGTLESVSTAELIEVHLVNAIAPFILTSRLKPLFLCSPHERRFVVNVSAMEGQFNVVNDNDNTVKAEGTFTATQ